MEKIKALKIKLSPDLIEVLDKICRDRGITRSQYYKEIIKKHSPEWIFELSSRLFSSVEFVSQLGFSSLDQYEDQKDIIFTGFHRDDFYKMYPNRQVFKEKFYTSPEWGEVSLEVLNRDNYTCQICGKKPSRNVHHKRDAYSFPEMCLLLKNLITVCDKHHNEWHNR